MTEPRVRTRGPVVGVAMAAALVVLATVVPAGSAHADAAFRKKKAPATDSAGSEAAPSGGEVGNAPEGAGGEAAAPAKTEYVPQAEDRDRPHDPSLLAPKPADAALAKKAKKDEGPPIYQKWQFWAITGAIVVGVIGAVWGGTKLAHEINGGDIRACGPQFGPNCFGQGR
jgi:hypothetical protein